MTCGFHLGEESSCAQQVRRAVFHHDFGFKVQPGREPQILMEWPGVAIDASVFAAAIGIDACVEPNIGAVVVSDYGLRLVVEELRCGRGVIFGVPIGVAFQFELLESVGRIGRCAARGNGLFVVVHTAQGRLRCGKKRTQIVEGWRSALGRVAQTEIR